MGFSTDSRSVQFSRKSLPATDNGTFVEMTLKCLKRTVQVYGNSRERNYKSKSVKMWVGDDKNFIFLYFFR